MACKSGFALYFYENKETLNPSSPNVPMIQLCVTVKGVEEKIKNVPLDILEEMKQNIFIIQIQHLQMAISMIQINFLIVML